MVLDAPAPTFDEGARSTTVRIRSRYLTARDAAVPVSIWLGEPPVLLNGCEVIELSFSWGAGSDQGVITNVDAGSGTLRLYDPERYYDPTVSTIVRIGTPVRVSLAGVPAFRGRVDDIDHDLVVATFALVDDISALAAVQFVETNVPAETSSARVTRILDLAGWPADRRDITAGGVALQAGTVSQEAWTELVEVARNELGAVYMRPDGAVAFRPRAAAWAGGAPAMTFGCPPSDAYLTDLGTRGDISALVNYLSTSRRTGTARVLSDAASIATFGVHSYVQNDLELAADGDRDLWQDFYLRRQKDPVRGIGGFAAHPGAAAIAKALAMPFGAIVRIVDEGHGPAIDRPARWLGARWSVSPTFVELLGVVGEDASIRLVPRTTTIDTPAQWTATANAGVGPAVNIAAREPGLVVDKIGPMSAGPLSASTRPAEPEPPGEPEPR